MAVARVTSEALQEAVRRLLPSQSGFGVDLAASNVITPIIDLTPTAEGSTTAEYLQRALDYSSTYFFIQNASNTAIVNTAGFWQVTFTITVQGNANANANLAITDGTTAKTIYNVENSGGQIHEYVIDRQLIVFLRSGDTLQGTSTSNNEILTGSYRQVADINGVLTNPLGFAPQ